MKYFDVSTGDTHRRTPLQRRLGFWLPLGALWLLCAVSSVPAEVRYRVVQVVTNEHVNAILSYTRGINRHGDVAGTYIVDRGTNAANYPYPYDNVPFVYTDGVGAVALIGPEVRLSASAHGINDRGQVALSVTREGLGALGYRYTPATGIEFLGTLGVEGDIGDQPNGLNNLGQVVGYSDTLRDGRPWQEAFLYTDGAGIVNLGSLGPNRYATASAINDAGQITGHSGGEVFVYTEATGMVAIGQGSGFAINRFGVVAGDVGYRAAIFEHGTTRPLGNLGESSWANGINDHNVVVGQVSYFPVTRRTSGFLWTARDGMVDLELLVEPGWCINDVWAINNNGQVVGEAWNEAGGGTGSVAVRLDPIPPKLAIQRGATNLTVSWIPAWPGVVLQATESLNAPDWQPVDSSSTNVVSLPQTGASRFFRLNLEALRGLYCPGMD